jgi:hypothetical protein
MSATSEYLLKLAYDEYSFYRTQLQLNWLAALQGAVLLAAGPYLVQHVIGRTLERPDLLFHSTKIVDYAATGVLMWLALAFSFLAFQVIPSRDPPRKKDLATLAVSYAAEEGARLGMPLALCSAEAQELTLEIVRLRLIREMTAEIELLKKRLLNRKVMQVITTAGIAVPIPLYIIVLISGG